MDQNGHTGYGITFSEEEVNEISEPLPSHSSIFQPLPWGFNQAEAIAIWQASKIINHNNLSNLNIEFYTDSQTVLNSLQKRITKHSGWNFILLEYDHSLSLFISP